MQSAHKLPVDFLNICKEAAPRRTASRAPKIRRRLIEPETRGRETDDFFAVYLGSRAGLILYTIRRHVMSVVKSRSLD